MSELIVLDRDGVLNRSIGDPSIGRVYSPLSVSQVEVFPWVPETLLRLSRAGYVLVVATNQPAAAKGEATLEAVQAVNELVLARACEAGAVLSGCYVCWHKAQDGCACRKPKPGLLNAALAEHPECRPEDGWMVGDRAIDVIAGAAAGLRTALVGPDVKGDDALLAEKGLVPDFRGANLRDFADFVLGRKDATKPATKETP